MFVKMFTAILDSSLAEDQKLRHFFMDLLLLADADGLVCLTERRIAARTGWSEEEVSWGLAELQKPDPGSRSLVEDGRRILAVEGQGHTWLVVNYQEYRGMRTSEDVRNAAAERMRRYRQNKAAGGNGNGGSVGRTPRARSKALPGEEAAQRTDGRGAEAIAAESVSRFEALPTKHQVSTFAPDPPLAQVSAKEPEAVPVLEGAVPAVPPGEGATELDQFKAAEKAAMGLGEAAPEHEEDFAEEGGE